LNLARELPPVPSEAWRLKDNVALLDTVYPQFKLDCMVVLLAPAVACLTRSTRVADPAPARSDWLRR
jgi:hypothetical protein